MNGTVLRVKFGKSLKVTSDEQIVLFQYLGGKTNDNTSIQFYTGLVEKNTTVWFERSWHLNKIKSVIDFHYQLDLSNDEILSKSEFQDDLFKVKLSILR